MLKLVHNCTFTSRCRGECKGALLAARRHGLCTFACPCQCAHWPAYCPCQCAHCILPMSVLCTLPMSLCTLPMSAWTLPISVFALCLCQCAHIAHTSLHIAHATIPNHTYHVCVHTTHVSVYIIQYTCQCTFCPCDLRTIVMHCV